jgi:hypothetical protein
MWEEKATDCPQRGYFKMSGDYFGFNSTQEKSLRALIADLATSIANINAWATTLATKLNADTGVADTNYDTNPQA